MEIDKEQVYHDVFSQTEKMEKRLLKKKTRLMEIDAQLERLTAEKATLTKEVAAITHKNAASAYENLDRNLKSLGIDVTDKETFGKMLDMLSETFGKQNDAAEKEAMDLFPAGEQNGGVAP